MKVKHVLNYCVLCETEAIICGACGNNCCNGGVKDVSCPDCPAAYDAQDFIHNFYESLKLIQYKLRNESR